MTQPTLIPVGRLLALSMLALALAVTPARAELLAFTSEASFVAAASGLSVESFESPFESGTTVAFPGFTARELGPDPGLGLFRSSAFSTDGSFSLAVNLDSGSDIVFDFASPINAFGINFLNLLGLQLILQTGTGDFVPLSTALTSFVGIISADASFTQVVLLPAVGSKGEFLAFDELYFGRVTPIPEPSTLTLLGLGSLGLMGCCRRRLRVG